jgi:hypothetical protein
MRPTSPATATLRDRAPNGDGPGSRRARSARWASVGRSALLVLLAGALLPTATHAQDAEDPDEEELTERKLRPWSWQASAGGGGGWDNLDFFEYGGTVSGGFGKHTRFRRSRATHGDWLGLWLGFDTAQRWTVGARYGWMVAWDQHAWSYQLTV